MNKEAFVYCWTDKLTNMLYVGSHKGSDNDGYICSSKIMLEQYKNRPQDFTREIIAYGSFLDIIKLETKILQSEQAATNPIYYNLTNSDGKFHYIYGKGLKGSEHPNWGKRGELSPLYGRIGILANKKWYNNPKSKECNFYLPGTEPEGWILGRYIKEESKQNMKRTGNSYWKNKTHKFESKELNRQAHINKKQSEETILKRNITMSNLSQEVKNSMVAHFIGSKWYYDPITKQSNRYHPGTEPEGWILGRYSRKKIKEGI